MSKFTKGRLAASNLVIAALLFGQNALAQESGTSTPVASDSSENAAPDDGRRLGVVTVNARRVEESLQDVPISISAVSAESLEALQVDSFQDFRNIVPNLNIQEQFGQPSTPQVYLRGVATGLLNFTVDAGVAMYVDGVYIGRSVGSAFSQPDLQQVEVMRGPQGTLFGRNSTGGAINFITASPEEEFSAKADLTLGNYDLRRYRATLNTGDLGGIAARITYSHNEHDGYVDNSGPKVTWTLPQPFGTIQTADSFGLVDEDSVFAAVSFTGVENLSVDYKFDWNDQTASQLAVQFLGVDPLDPANNFADGFRLGAIANGGDAPSSTNRLDSLPLSFNTPGQTEVTGHALTVAYDLSDKVTLKSISSYREMNQFSGGNDIDGGNWVDPTAATTDLYCMICSIAVRDHNQFTQEFQVLGDFERFNYVVGAYYFKEEGSVNNPTFATRTFPGNASGPIGLAGAALSVFGLPDYFLGEYIDMENEAKAVYGQATFDLSDRVTLTGGLRYTEDDRKEHDFLLESFALPADFDVSFDSTDYTISLTYAVNDDVNLYATHGTGYVTGGILRGAIFKPEDYKSYEVGVKSTLLDNTLIANAAVFFADRSGIQTTTFGATGIELLNQGTAETQGLEVELTYQPTSNWNFNLGYGYTDTDFSVPQGTGYPDQNLILGSQFTSNPLSNGSRIEIRLDLGWTSEYDGFQVPLIDRDFAAAISQGDQWDVGLRASLADIPLGANSTGRVSLWGKNLLDNDKPEFVRTLFGFAGGNFQVPQTYGVDLSVEF